ncbi:hypothetical protein JCM11251_006877 [Rhodosporidiobolus azoricus]
MELKLASAYSALAAELTRTEIKNLGGYSLGRVIGEGSFGKVRLGVHRLTGTRVAVKQVPKSLPGGSATDPSSPLSLLTRELHHHRRLRHPHLLTLYELLATESSIYLVTELCAGGELFDYLVEHGRLSLSETRRIFAQLCLGVAYLHGEGVVHRDLKLENVLLDAEVNVKIADLGFAREMESGGGGGKWLDTKVGTVGYSAPELIRGEKYLGEQIDIWSLGIILYALVTGSLPFDDDDEQVMRDLILKGEYDMPTWLDPDVSSLIRLILVPNPSQRPSLHTILSHSFFTRTTPDPDMLPTAPMPMSSSTSVASAEGLAPLTKTISNGGAWSSSSSLVSLAPAPIREGASHYPPPIPEDGSPSLATWQGAESMSAVKAGKQRAIQDDMPYDEGDDDAGERSDTLSSSLPIPPSSSASPFRPRRPSSSSVDQPFSAPPLQRTTSAGGASIVSTHSHNLSLGPHTPHARTPSRTKRRSIGSIISERLVSLNEDVEAFGDGNVAGVYSSSPSPAPPPALPRVDYLSLLHLPRQAPLSTPAEQKLLDSLSTLGMDAGQVAHSVRTHACDSCAAVWWMLKRKMDEKELERLRMEEEAVAAEGTAAGAGTSISRTSSLRSLRVRGRRGSMRGMERGDVVPEEGGGVEKEGSRLPPSPLRVEEYTLLPPVPTSSLSEALPLRRPRTPSPPMTTSSLPPPVATPQTPSFQTRHSSAAPSIPSSARRAPIVPGLPSVSDAAVGAPSSDAGSTNSADPPTHDPEARLDYFLQYPPGSQSAPLLSYFPTIIDPSSPGRNRSMPRSKSKDHLSSSPSLQAHPQPVVSPYPSPGPDAALASPAQAVPLGSPLRQGSGEVEADEGARKSRNRAGSTSQLLARATSALGTSLSLKKSAGGSGGSEVSTLGTPGGIGGAEEDPFTASGGGSGKGMFSPRKSSLPSDDPRLINPRPSSSPSLPAPTSLPASPKKQHYNETNLPSTPPRPHLPPSASSSTASGQGSPAPPTPRSADPPAVAAVATASPTPSPLLSAVDAHETCDAATAPSKTWARPPGPTRPMSLGSLSALGGGSSSSGSGKKSLKGANLLNTFKHWFGEGQRKRNKRASMMPRMGASDPGGIPQIVGGGPGYNAATSVASGLNRSQSLYVASPLRRPPMGSRRSSNQSLAATAAGQPGGAGGGGISRRSSVSSAHRTPIDFTPGRPTLGHNRRPSSDSRASFTSERDHSRPASLRSFSGQHGSAPRKRHSKATSFSSTGSHATSLGKEAIYRRPPTTTTVRRRQGSHGRYGSSGHGHRRSASGATSTSHRSSLSDADASGSAPEDEGIFEDEPALGGAAVIEEEDEGLPEEEEAIVQAVEMNEEDEATKVAARARALRSLSGEFTTPHALSKPGSVHSTSSSHHHPPRPYHPSTFTAHKTTHVFGSPSQPHAPPTSSSSTARRVPPPPRPPLRDIFASARSPENEHGDWIDEEDELAGYGGGLGQGRAGTGGGPAGGSASGAGLALSNGGMDASTAAFVDSPVADRVWSGGAGKFASRYAGVDAGVGGGGGVGERAMTVSRPAALIEEEEEEEEE